MTRFADHAALGDQLLLDGGQLLVGDLDAHVAAADHDALAFPADVLDVVDAGLVLDLGDQADAAAPIGLEELVHVDEILPDGDERAGDVVDVVLDAKEHILLVLLAQVDLLEHLVREAHALAVGQLAAVDDGAVDVVALDVVHDERQQAVVEQHAVAGVEVVDQTGVVDRHARLVAFDVVHRQRKRLALFEHDLAVLERADAVFRALRVQHDRDWEAELLAHALDRLDLAVVLPRGCRGKS